MPELPFRDELVSELRELQRRLTELETGLRASEQEKEWLEDNLRRRTRDLNERMKELQCLYEISEVFDRISSPVAEIAARLVELLPPAWRHAGMAWARVMAGTQEFKTANYRKTDFVISEQIFPADGPSEAWKSAICVCLTATSRCSLTKNAFCSRRSPAV